MARLTKVCSKCGEEKNISEFDTQIKIIVNILGPWCRNCRRKYLRQYYKKNSKLRRHSYLQTEYGITETQYELMLKSQNGVCAICQKPETVKQNSEIKMLAVDHCHKTHKIRDLLCNTCNLGLRWLEKEDWTPKALAYLEKHND